ncbi:hypothetical protein RhiJN_10406 [Ceratobasidium sp. AG-Ba]|nr:hypothetical protein RhiJN_10406 [Ceratobasidium sp. AG-Ba]QRW11139.1 hypothetical protein RhiLY_10138 [Ceratobasidium sp. AG-Ba]
MNTFITLTTFLSIMLIVLIVGLPTGASELFGDVQNHSHDVFARPNVPTPSKSTYGGPGDLFGSSLIRHLAPVWPQPPSVSVTHPGYSYLDTGISAVSDQFLYAKQRVLYVACEARPPVIDLRIARYTYWAVYGVRGRYCRSYRRAIDRIVPVPAPLNPPLILPLPVSPLTPPSSKTEGSCLIPSRTFTTSADRPAMPTPAHAWVKRGMYAYDQQEAPAPLPSSPWPLVTIDQRIEFDMGCRPSRLRGLRSRSYDLTTKGAFWFNRLDRALAHFRLWGIGLLGTVFDFPVIDILALIIGLILMVFLPLKVHFGYFNFGQTNNNSQSSGLDCDPTVQIVVHYAYRLTVKAERLEGDSLEYAYDWVVSGDHEDREALEQRGWADVGRTLRLLEVGCDDELIVVGVEVTRTTQVFDVLNFADIEIISNRVDELCTGQTFWSQTWFMSDPGVVPGYIEELPEASLDSFGN